MKLKKFSKKEIFISLNIIVWCLFSICIYPYVLNINALLVFSFIYALLSTSVIMMQQKHVITLDFFTDEFVKKLSNDEIISYMNKFPIDIQLRLEAEIRSRYKNKYHSDKICESFKTKFVKSKLEFTYVDFLNLCELCQDENIGFFQQVSIDKKFHKKVVAYRGIIMWVGYTNNKIAKDITPVKNSVYKQLKKHKLI